MKIHEKYIRRCLQLGENALGIAAPNPMVGCVIVYENHIIGEGYTSAYGGPHAEVNAIKGVKDPDLLRKATLYVSLEPCCHQGKTPPCTDLILSSGIKNIVIGIPDPHTRVGGKGIAQLKEAGCDVVVPVLESECREHHRRFFTYHEKKRPYIILKWAETLDRFLAPDNELRKTKSQPYWITNTLSRQLVHQWRSEEQAIMVGSGTVIADNPELTVRDWNGQNPMRVIWDTQLEASDKHRIFNNQAPTLVITAQDNISNKAAKVIKAGADSLGPSDVVDVLYKEGIQSVIVEGGSKTLSSFIEAGIWDEARVFVGHKTFGNGIPAPSIHGHIIKQEQIDDDHLTWYRND